MKREMIYRTDAMAAIGNLKGLSDADRSKAMQAMLDVPSVQTCDDAVSRQAAIYAILRSEALVRAYGYRYAADAVRELPAVQPQQIVRCKDCKYWREHKYAKETKRYIPFCGFNAINTKADDYCSRAERRTDEQT